MIRASLRRCSRVLLGSNVRQLRCSNGGLQFRRSIGTLDDDSSFVTIGDVHVPFSPKGSGRPDLVPTLPSGLKDIDDIHKILPPCHFSHLRWILQKDLALQQDFLLMGSPELSGERRHLILLYAALLGREVEYISISRDTSEADLKQRKEVTNRGTVYVDQAPVRAAMNGRLLILDGLEKAERNVLPTLNNLLENRELPLDDGSILVSPELYDEHQLGIHPSDDIKIHRVHPDFRVAALSSLSPGESVTLDPPLRSRFQGRLASAVEIGDILVAASAGSSGLLNQTELKNLVQMVGEVPRCVPLQRVHDTIRYLEKYHHHIEPKMALDAHGLNLNIDSNVLGATANDIRTRLDIKVGDTEAASTSKFIETRTTKATRDLILAAFDSGNRAVVCVGPKGCYKSSLARETAVLRGVKHELFSLHPDMTSRDLFMVRGTDQQSGDTIWRETPLTRAVREGSWVILDGIDKLRSDTLSSLALLIEQGWTTLPDGKRIQAEDAFRCIAIAHPPSEKQWITPEIKPIFHWIEVCPLKSEELGYILMGLYPSLDRDVLKIVLNLQEQLDQAVNGGVADTLNGKESLILTLRKMKHICRRVEQRGSNKLATIVHNTLMTSFMADRERRTVETCMRNAGITEDSASNNQDDCTLDEELLASCRRNPSNPLLVPNPRFEENPGQAQVMSDILEAHSVGEKALLISGYQGVGKNRIVDHLLSILNCEREYLQLHRDTTIQSLMSTPSVEHGRIVFQDSPLVRAAKHGRILVLDEADKAPVEVVALLKGLIEDGQLALPDGRILCNGECVGDDYIPIHPDFCIWTLTNPAGFPFHGNDLAREMSDIFSCHNVNAMDMKSHERILNSYGPAVQAQVIDNIVHIWEELRIAHEKGLLLYPFSIRESVNVVKHLNEYPNDGIENAIENIVAFDRLDMGLARQLHQIFAKYGVSILGKDAYSSDTRGDRGGISTPKTRTSNPKHGKIDPENNPHIGGNTWAGGTGGSDTLGLGGRGGYGRLDLGHPVHQVSEEMKAEVSNEAKRRAEKMAKEALEQKLKDLDMGKLDWKRYNNLRQKVDVQIQQLRSHLKDLRKRNEERIWLKRQSTGELDDSRLVDALSGEKDVFKRRGSPQESNNDLSLSSHPVTLRLIVDISASMYRFNGYDGRLERLLEAAVMIMESIRDDPRFKLFLIGHNGSSANIPLVNPDTSLDEATQLRVLECMIANTQYTFAGDNTVDAINLAVTNASEGDLILVISDANLERYRITPGDLALLQSSSVHAHLILIGSLGDEARVLAEAIPNERAQVCFESTELPLIIKKIVTNSLK